MAAAATLRSRAKCCSRLARSERLSASAAPGFASTTKSHAGRARWRRKASRANRLSRLRSTARFAARREMVRPRRAIARPPGLARMVKKRSVDRAGFANTRPNSAAVCKRCSGVNPSPLGGNAVPKRRLLRRETRAAFGAAAGENFAAAGGGHSRTEAVRSLAMQVAGLESSFHTGLPRERKSSWETKGCTSEEAANCTRR